jgi:hypothetical protein
MRHWRQPSAVDDLHLHDNDHDNVVAVEKSISPTGGNLFTPGVKAPPAPAVPPGQHPGINGVP